MQHGGYGRGVGIFQQGNVRVRVKSDTLDKVARQHVRRTAVTPCNDDFAAEEICHILVAVGCGGEPRAREQVDVGAVDAVDDGDDGISISLIGKIVAVYAADDRKCVAGDDRSHMRAARRLHDRHVQPLIRKIALVNRDIQGQIADEVHRLGDDELLRCVLCQRKAGEQR